MATDAAEHSAAFKAWLRDPDNEKCRADLIKAERSAVAARDFSAADATGGYAVPEKTRREILEWLSKPVYLSRLTDLRISVLDKDWRRIFRALNPRAEYPRRVDFPQRAKVLTVSNRAYDEFVEKIGAEKGWVGENGAQ